MLNGEFSKVKEMRIMEANIHNGRNKNFKQQYYVLYLIAP